MERRTRKLRLWQRSEGRTFLIIQADGFDQKAHSIEGTGCRPRVAALASECLRDPHSEFNSEPASHKKHTLKAKTLVEQCVSDTKTRQSDCSRGAHVRAHSASPAAILGDRYQCPQKPKCTESGKKKSKKK